MSLSRRMDKKAVVRIHNGIFSAIKKNVFESVLMRWMKLEPIIQSEVSQKGKHQYSTLTHINGIQKHGNDDPVCETAKETQMYRTDFQTLGEGEGEGGMIWENGNETCIIIHDMNRQSRFDA